MLFYIVLKKRKEFAKGRDLELNVFIAIYNTIPGNRAIQIISYINSSHICIF